MDLKIKNALKALIVFTFVGVMFFTAKNSLYAGIYSTFSGTCESCGGTIGTYIWCSDKHGGYTIFIPDGEDGEVIIGEGHGTFITGGIKGQPINGDTYNFPTTFSQVGDDIIITPENEPEPSMPVEVVIIDLQTGNIWGDYHSVSMPSTTVSISNLSTGCKYAASVVLNVLGRKIPIRSYNFCKE